MRRSHLLTDDAGYLYTRYVTGRVNQPHQYCGPHASASSGPCPEHLDRRVVGFAGRLRTRPGRQSALRHRLRRRPAGAARHRRNRPDGPPAIAAPKNDLSWHDCTSQVFSDAAVQPLPGVTLDCASYDADLDPINGATGSVSIGVVRARSVQTPEDAGPLVMTTGSDLPSSVQLPVWLSRAGADVLKTHPIVAVDRRGMGMSSPIDCRDLFDRQEMLDQAQFQSGDDPVANLGAITMTATTSCTDTIAPGDSAYDNAHAAEDIERLRSTWDVPALALLGIGNGAQVALAYAGSHPDKVARLVLDSPLPLGIAAEAAAEQQVKGQQAALDAFAAQCAAVNCPLGPDPKGAVDALLADARAGNGPGGASVATVADAISTALAFPRGDRTAATNSLAVALAAARSGDANQLTNLINQADALRQTDGQFVNSCSDALNRPTPDRVRELVVAWAKLYPQFGTVGALNLVKCLNWPSGSAAAGAEEPQDPRAAARRAERPDRRQRGRRRQSRPPSSTPAPPASG